MEAIDYLLLVLVGGLGLAPAQVPMKGHESGASIHNLVREVVARGRGEQLDERQLLVRRLLVRKLDDLLDQTGRDVKRLCAIGRRRGRRGGSSALDLVDLDDRDVRQLGGVGGLAEHVVVRVDGQQPGHGAHGLLLLAGRLTRCSGWLRGRGRLHGAALHHERRALAHAVPLSSDT